MWRNVESAELNRSNDTTSPTLYRGLRLVLADIGRRPVVALSRDAAIPRLGRTIIAPCTTTIRGLPSEVLLEVDDDPIPRTSAINLDSIESVAVGVLVERFGRLSDARMREVCAALEIAVDCRP
jgi:mRNA interferase MazF